MAYRAAVVPGNGTGWVSVSGQASSPSEAKEQASQRPGISRWRPLRAEAYEPEGTSGNWKALGRMSGG